jgi:hypothetical protein
MKVVHQHIVAMFVTMPDGQRPESGLIAWIPVIHDAATELGPRFRVYGMGVHMPAGLLRQVQCRIVILQEYGVGGRQGTSADDLV